MTTQGAQLFYPASLADAIFPSLFLVWPLTILLFVPVVLIETMYARRRLRIVFWKLTRVTFVANLLSAAAGLPIAHLLGAGLQYLLEVYKFKDVTALREQAARLHLTDPGKLQPHDSTTLMWLGLYPAWIPIVSAVTMMAICYLLSWWIEGKWLERYVRRTDEHSDVNCMKISRNANLLSYAFLMVVVVWVLLALWPHSVAELF